MNLRSVAARGALIAAVVVAVSFMGEHVPRDQTLVIRLDREERDIARVSVVFTQIGETEPAGGFSQDFPDRSPRVVRHAFSAPNGDYRVEVTLKSRAPTGAETTNSGLGASSGDVGPIPSETSFERRVNLDGGENIISPD